MNTAISDENESFPMLKEGLLHGHIFEESTDMNQKRGAKHHPLYLKSIIIMLTLNSFSDKNV